MSNNKGLLFSVMAVCLALACAVLFTGRVAASPAAPGEFLITQPDGTTTFLARQWGDEWNHGVETSDGFSILQTEDGWWVYAEPQAEGLLGPSLLNGNVRRVGIDAPEGLKPHFRPRLLKENPNSLESMGAEMIPDINESPEVPELTTLKTLVLLAEFTDTPYTYTEASFASLMFGSSASVRDFYKDNSFNNMDIVPASESCGTSNDGVTVWTNVGANHPDPNDGGSITTANLDIVKDVLVANDGCIQFDTFDTNGNGYIDTSELVIIVVVAGGETSYSSTGKGIWAHQAWLNLATGGAPTLDGKIVGYSPYGNYAQFGEKHYDHQATIGVMAHEYGHVINWPDLYDTDYSSEGVGAWSIMSGGSWNGVTNDGDSPAFADAFLKWYQGWITPTAVSGAQYDVSIPQAETNPVAYLLRPNSGGVDWHFGSHSGTGEYFLVENRQNNAGAGYDDGLPGCGLLIWHIDETRTYTNSANANESRALVWLEQADGQNDLWWPYSPSDTGDPYPGSTNNHNFNSATNPNSNLYSGSASLVSVRVDSTSCASSMQADLAYGSTGFSLPMYLPMIRKDATASTGWTTIKYEDFEGSFPSGWTLNDFDGGNYIAGKRTCRPYAGSNSGWMVGGGAGAGLSCGSNYPYNVNSWMEYGPFSTVGATAAQLNFQHWTNVEDDYYGSVYDYFCAWASTDGNNYYGYCFWGNWGGWHSYSMDLADTTQGSSYPDNFMNDSSVWIAFTLHSDFIFNYPEGAYVDNIMLRKCMIASCPASSPEFSANGMMMDALDFFLDPFVIRFSGPSSTFIEH